MEVTGVVFGRVAEFPMWSGMSVFPSLIASDPQTAIAALW